MSVRLPTLLVAQFDELARARGQGRSDCLASIISSAKVAGEIPDTMPGFPFGVAGGTVSFGVGETVLEGLAPSEAEDVAASLERVATSNSRHMLVLGPGLVKVERVGNGVAIEAYADKRAERRTVVPGQARDLARGLRAAARRAKGEQV